MNVSTNMFEVLFGPPRTGGRLESRICKPWGSSSTLGTYRSCGVVSNEAPAGLWDSLFEAGNNNYVDSLPGFRSNCWPNGKSTFQFPTGRVSDGRIMIDFIAEHAWLLLLLPSLQPGYSNSQLTYGLNFATTAAGVLVGTFPGVVMRRLKLGPAQWCHGSWDKKN
ncbi:hypothetical protein F2Q70_00009979 [Brassica cretica]|uniref:Uncharacterized protein n=2 Tax=Brassica cretica TaxID=69181 RepID=A0A8S9JPJ4_BRACR|nr:hypothetical protein F2Q68_00002966 [Brassica cretica]KAF2611271.1 hypothetical protein F2Q70_00009979 [Brassica cretica]KAF3547080.1 hypothetical protein DY000_02004176 [Brassica cretica]